MKTSNKLLVGFLILILLTILGFVGAASYYFNQNSIAGNGVWSSETRTTESFSEIKTKGKIKVFLTQGSGQKLEIKADQNIIPEIVTEVKDGKLTISSKSPIKRPKIEVYITIPEIKGLYFAAGSNLETTGEIRGEKLTFSGDAGATGKLNINYGEMECQTSSGASFEISGTAKKANVIISSGAHLNGENLSINVCSFNGSSGASAKLAVTDELSAEANSGASFSYSGNPQIKNISNSSGGSISKK